MDHSELVERYFDSNLSDEELQVFMQQLDADAKFSQDFFLHHEVNEALEERDVMSLRKKMNNIGQQNKVKTKHSSSPKPVFKRKAFLVAASLSLILLVGTLYQTMLNRSYSNEKLFSMYYEGDANILTVRSGNSTVDENINNGMMSYENGNYEAAILNFQHVLEKNEDNLMVYYYLGLSNIEAGNYSDAINAFQFIIDHEHNLYVERAEWYQGLCFLKTNDTDKALNQFASIADNDTSAYNDEASRILRNIKN